MILLNKFIEEIIGDSIKESKQIKTMMNDAINEFIF